MKIFIFVLTIFMWTGMAEAGFTDHSFKPAASPLPANDNAAARPLRLAQSNNNRNRGGNSGLSVRDAIILYETNKELKKLLNQEQKKLKCRNSNKESCRNRIKRTYKRKSGRRKKGVKKSYHIHTHSHGGPFSTNKKTHRHGHGPTGGHHDFYQHMTWPNEQ